MQNKDYFSFFILRLLMGLMLMLCYTNMALATVDKTSFYTNFERANLVDQDNKPFVFEAYQGKLMLVNFIFTQCSAVCPIQTKQIADIKQSLSPALRKKVVFVSVSLDPLGDKPKILKQFVGRMHINTSNWFFLTGKLESIANIANRLQLFGNPAQAGNAKNPDDHTTALWLINQNGTLVMRYSGVPVDVERIAKELKQLSELMQK